MHCSFLCHAHVICTAERNISVSSRLLLRSSNHKKIPDTLDRDATFDEIVAAIQASKLNDIFKMWYTRVYRTLLLMRQMVSVGSVELGDVTVDANDVASYQQMCKESGLIRAVVNALDAVNLRMFFGNDGKAFVKQFRLGSQLIMFGNLCHVFVQVRLHGLLQFIVVACCSQHLRNIQMPSYPFRRRQLMLCACLRRLPAKATQRFKTMLETISETSFLRILVAA